MLQFIRTHWSTISTGLLVATLLGAGGVETYRALSSDCCYEGSPCCYPGSSCCHGHQKVAER